MAVEHWLRGPDGIYCAGDAIDGATRRDHGLLVVDAPRVGACVLLAQLDATLIADGREVLLAPRVFVGSRTDAGAEIVSASVGRTAVVELEAAGRRLRRTIWLERASGTTACEWTLIEGDPCTITLRPFLAMRPVHGVRAWTDASAIAIDAPDPSTLVARTTGMPSLSLACTSAFERAPDVWFRFLRAGDGTHEDLFTPGAVRASIDRDTPVRIGARADASLTRAELVALTAPSPEWRSADPDEDEPATLARAWSHLQSELLEHIGQRRSRSVVIPRFPDPGERVGSTALVVPALLRADECERAEELLASVVDELVPAITTPGCAADAGLWLVEAVRALRVSGTVERPKMLDRYYPACLRVIEAYANGTDAIAVGEDGLVAVRPGVATWLDALCDGASDARAGKPIELSAAWHAALHTTADLATEARALVLAAELRALAKRSRAGFVATFWDDARGTLADRVRPDGTLDASIRAFSLLALGCAPPLLDVEPATRALSAVADALLTDRGVRTLAADVPEHDANDRVRGAAWPAFLGAFARAARRAEHAPELVERGRAACRSVLALISQHPLAPAFGAEGALGGSPLAWNAAELMAATRALLDVPGLPLRTDAKPSWSPPAEGPTQGRP